MSGPALLARAAAAGLRLRLEEGKVRWRAVRLPPPALLAELRANRWPIAAALAADLCFASFTSFAARMRLRSARRPIARRSAGT